MAIVRPIHDQRRLISSSRPCGPAAPSITIGKRTAPIVDGMEATAQIATIDRDHDLVRSQRHRQPDQRVRHVRDQSCRAVPLDGLAAALEELADRDRQGEAGDGRDRGQEADREGRPAQARDEDGQERRGGVDDAHRDRIPAHDPGVVDRVRPGRPARPEPGQRDRRVGQGGRAREAPHDRGPSANARVDGRGGRGRHPTHETGEGEGEIGGDRRGDRGDDGVLGRGAGRRDARDRLPRPAADGADGARAGAAARPATRRRLLGHRGADLARGPVHRGRRPRTRTTPPTTTRRSTG